MSEPILLSNLFHIKPRFSRSVNVAKDYGETKAIEGYIITPLTSIVLSRVFYGLTHDTMNRSWSITGPYGSGKSACCLFLSKVLGIPGNIDTQNSRKLLHKSDSKTYESIFKHQSILAEKGLIPILLTGNREPMGTALLRALDEAIVKQLPSNSRLLSLRRKIQKLTKKIERNLPVPATEILLLFEEFSHKACSQNNVAGVLIVVDELGKLLEYASLHPDKGDIFILQNLAEAASRSGNKPILLVTILHQSFERYAARIGLLQQREWTKVQGRFENIPFLEGNEQMLSLMGAAIEKSQRLDGLSKIIEKEATKAISLALKPHNMSPDLFQSVLKDCAPLHPTTALVLPPLFKGELSQNERSLFAFLSSGEPFGLQEFLHHTKWQENKNKPFYRIDIFYDYIVGTLGSALMTHAKGKRWAEIADAIERLPNDCQPIDISVVKAIGLLGILGDKRYLKASEAVLSVALADNVKEVKKSLERLKNWNIAIYRKHADAYVLWEGSDIDLDESFQIGLTRLNQSSDIASLISSRYQPYPYVAKKHLHEKGTLRYFKPIFMRSIDIEKTLHDSFDDADGRIIFVIPEGGQTPHAVVKAITQYSLHFKTPLRELTFFAVPDNADTIQQSLEELMAWEWVRKNTPELEGDRIARKELLVRLSEAKGRFEKLCDNYFDKNSSYHRCLWVYCGEKISFANSRELSKALSDACDSIFYKAPIIDNELVNRRILSSTAAAARASLMEHMIASPNIRGFGIEGTPPAMSIYISVLKRTGIHHKKGSSYIFGIPSDDIANVKGVWEGMDEFFLTTEQRRRCVKELFEILKQPPYGLKDGILPILLLARVLQDSSEIAIYEDGMFVPNPNAAFFERLVKAPQRVEIQRYRISGARKDIFQRLASILNSVKENKKMSFLDAVRPLFQFIAKLPPYCHTTQSVGASARKVRQALLNAREPHRVIFEELPKALSLEPIRVSSSHEETEVFLKKLKEALIELQRAYDILLSKIEQKLKNALMLPVGLNEARYIIKQRGGEVVQMVSDVPLKAFVLRLIDGSLNERKWTESVASFVAAKPPAQWNDQDIIRFEARLADLSGQFKRIEEIAIERRNKQADPSAIRSVLLGITDNTGTEYRQISHISEKDEKQILRLTNELIHQLQASTKDRNIQTAVLAELSKYIIMNNHKQENE